jgi:alpha-galactosidase
MNQTTSMASIAAKDQSRDVTLSAGGLSLVLFLPSRGMPEILYFGRGDAAPQPHILRAGRNTGMGSGMDLDVPSATVLPTGGMGFYGWPAILGHRDGVDPTLEFSRWTAKKIHNGLLLKAEDKVSHISIEIELHAAHGVLATSVTLGNLGKTAYTIDRCMAGSMVAGAGPATVTGFHGHWGREFQTSVDALGQGVWLKENRRGRTSHDKFPALVVDFAGQQIVMHLGWSGGSLFAIDRLDDGRRLIHAGEVFEPGEMRLPPGAAYTSPKVYFGFDTADFRNLLREDILQWPGGKMRPRPVTLNTWEGTYFDHKLDLLKAQATAAADLGIERFVLDDGWFGLRDDDTTSLGDWFIDTRKYPQGLAPLVDHVTSLGLEFGIWVEPEMVNPVSELYRQHPDWVLQVHGRTLPLSRNQLVLDLTRPEVSDHLFERLDTLLRGHAISYMKWDMNRDLVHAAGQNGGAVVSKQTHALYNLLGRLRKAHPEVEIESCASGGGRADYGILKYTHRIWTSDCTDALERLDIHRGASMFFPPEIIGSHISASPNHQTHRVHTLAFRAVVALAYHMGVELNPLQLSADERRELTHWISLHKRLRPLLHGPRGQFQLAPVDGRYVWGVVSEDTIIIMIAQSTFIRSEQHAPLRIAHDLQGVWHVAAVHPADVALARVSHDQEQLLLGKTRFDIRSLAEGGFVLPVLRPETAMILELKRVEGA